MAKVAGTSKKKDKKRARGVLDLPKAIGARLAEGRAQRESVPLEAQGAIEYDHQGEREVHGQRLMQAASDAFLGWVTGSGEQHRELYVRQLRDKKGSAEVELMTPARIALYAELCGTTLARAHARTGDAAKISGYLGDDDAFDRALERFAVAYADQNDADFAAFTSAVDEQRVDVDRGV